MGIVSVFVYSKSAKLLFHQHKESLCLHTFVFEELCEIFLHSLMVVNGPYWIQ